MTERLYLITEAQRDDLNAALQIPEHVSEGEYEKSIAMLQSLPMVRTTLKNYDVDHANYYYHIRIAELEAQLADAKQAARWESDLASQALADLAPYRKDAERLDWILDNASSAGGGDGFTLKVFVPVDCECVRTAIDTAIAEGKA